MRTYEINTNSLKSILQFTVEHSDCAVTFKNIDFKNNDFIAVAEEVQSYP